LRSVTVRVYKVTMINRTLALTLAACTFLAACATTDTTTSQNLSDIVRAERGTIAANNSTACTVPANLIGQSHTTLAGMKLKNPVRVLFSGDAVTGDPVSNRLNFKVNKKGVITDITCG